MRNLIISQYYKIPVERIEETPKSVIILTSFICNVVCLGFSLISNRIDNVMTVIGDTLNVFMCFMIPCI